LLTIELEIADRGAREVSIELGIDGFTHDSVHASKGADIYNPVHSVEGKTPVMAFFEPSENFSLEEADIRFNPCIRYEPALYVPINRLHAN
jgi:hypothetical protein